MEDLISEGIRELSDKNPWVRGEAAEWFVKLGDLAVPELIQTLKDGNVDGRKGSAWVLGKIAVEYADDEEMLKTIILALLEAVKDTEPVVERDAASALKSIGKRIEAKSSQDQPDKLEAQLVEIVGNADANSPGYRKMSNAAGGLLSAIANRRNQLRKTELHLPETAFRRPKAPKGAFRAAPVARMAL